MTSSAVLLFAEMLSAVLKLVQGRPSGMALCLRLAVMLRIAEGGRMLGESWPAEEAVGDKIDIMRKILPEIVLPGTSCARLQLATCSASLDVWYYQW